MVGGGSFQEGVERRLEAIVSPQRVGKLKQTFEGPHKKRRTSIQRFMLKTKSTVAASDYKRCDLPFQLAVFGFYEGWICRLAISIVLIVNFAEAVVRSQVDPAGDGAPRVWEAFDVAFIAIFSIELLLMLYGSWNRPRFWCSRKLVEFVFDVAVVAVGVSTTFFDKTNAHMRDAWIVLRALRSLQVFRLFYRVHVLRAMLKTIQRAFTRCLGTLFLMFCIRAWRRSFASLDTCAHDHESAPFPVAPSPFTRRSHECY